MNAKHTRGPWFVDFYTDTGGFHIYVDAPHATVCSRGPWNHRKDEIEANARLIAVAPELLDGLRFMQMLFECELKAFDREKVEWIREILAKATGEHA
jgi:hypothetical protein